MPKRKKGGRKKSSGDYDVGYGKPPEHSRFTKGVSGNPRGRPHVPTTVTSIVERIVLRKVKAVVDGRTTSMSMIEASLLQLAKRAMAGDPKAIRFYLDLIDNDEIFGPPPLDIRVTYIDPEDRKRDTNPEEDPSSSSSK